MQKSARSQLIERALASAVDWHQLPSRTEADTDGGLTLYFPSGIRFVARWDYTGLRATYVGVWRQTPRYLC